MWPPTERARALALVPYELEQLRSIRLTIEVESGSASSTFTGEAELLCCAPLMAPLKRVTFRVT